ncbi:aspartyl aminopeptidase, putative,metallo-peptidase, clan MH, family M20, putative [Trypanosoma cruzi]|uniref:aspartyl aminopeptidase n=2 Tax=Trypanosoma cruzi TaxID=5693 RepID=V5BC31_TRYCR|nr:aspartyl aminopeptidase, putative,metallo-peptidase, clan MH, family M20, putative [Trypanosoma cruzi]ESS70840.1 aspartyl aminopeptidase [Trypanosoma cruzi Dm28c]PBJ72671.1 aspartyl aminopeptidase,metallo-peptidase, clan MH [Trypanosoma cruzi cruzi]KAF8276373.1 putative aspartyl aminopeptidase [Trypanosoma cruzi]PWU95207.1 putative aspartyl aminopeptidase [Trypanosoma cruzi]
MSFGSPFSMELAKEFVEFVNKACTPFHAVEVISSWLLEAGYKRLKEDEPWPSILVGDRYFVTRNDSSLVAFSVGGKFEPANGVKIVGAHTDSPNLALKPRTRADKGEYQGIAVQCYGGGLWHTWFDRDLTVAGRVFLSSPKLEKRLVNLKRPIVRIPSLAIHLQTAQEREGFAPNKEKHLVPIIATEVSGALNGDNDKRHSFHLMKLISEALGCLPEEIVDYDLSVIDTQPATIGGAFDEFIFAPRLDNLISCFCGIKALLQTDKNLDTENMIRMVCLFDNEEIGSETSQGAGGTLVPDLIEHIIASKTLRATLVANSFLLSVDGAHALHPNYKDKHEENHRPLLHRGPVIKYNANMRYATNGATASIVKSIAKEALVPVQEFCVKNDSSCGSTIGPILSSLSGIRTVDIGNPMLSMHSVREMCGTTDISYLTNFIEAFFTNYGRHVISS